jgi:very-short-patch-repair endonuclease
MPDNLPQPLIYGPDKPTLGFLTVDGVQRVESRTNSNLFLAPDDFTEDGTLTFGRLLTLQQNAGCACADFSGDVCSFATAEVEEGVVKSLTLPGTGLQCGAYLRLGEFCRQSRAQRSFLKWWQVLGGYNRLTAQHALRNLIAKDSLQVHEANYLLHAFFLDFPALVPEVWLNYLDRNVRTEADSEHLQQNPGRVDFVMLADSRKRVIEIDGPSHYADFDEAQRLYTVSEQRYTKNLWVERSLRRSGWEIHRFSNWEVLRCDDPDFVEKRVKDMLQDMPVARQRVVSTSQMEAHLAAWRDSDDYIIW